MYMETIQKIATAVITAFKNGNMCYVAGNGGSDDLARHFEEEMLCTFVKERKPLPVLALKAHTSISNDFGYDKVFSRQLRAYGKPGDIFIGLTTSGKSVNINRANAVARELGMVVLSFPQIGQSTADIQENQLHFMHEVSRIVEDAFV